MGEPELIDLDQTDRERERDWGTFQREENPQRTEEIERQKKEQEERERQRRKQV